jgi:hypothetical protein
MANDFKRICTPSIGTSLTTIYAVPAGAGSSALESIVIGITMANKTTSGVTAVFGLTMRTAQMMSGLSRMPVFLQDPL